jgi:CheY-like chemotaxis protein/HPt (histidine-containing phosphotransfer) domain-containing protein
MDGRIWVDSTPDKGSTFHLLLPFQRREASPADRAPANDADLAGVRVLIVDDNATNRWILRDMLTHWGMEPTVVDDGPAALLAIDEATGAGTPFGLVLMDYQMPVMNGLDVARHIRQRADASTPIMLMLSSAGPGAEAARATGMGVTASLTKPVRRSVLKAAILAALGPTAPHAATAAPAPRRPAPGRRLRVLLAEDNLVNQRLFTAVLQKHSHALTVVDNGRAAVDAVAHEPFDVVLMDLQMPVMGGLEATELIRRAEAGTDRHIPIVALTAHALKGDRERCLDAGMDNYLAKPTQGSALLAMLQEVTGGGATPDADGPTVPAIDPDDVLARVDGDRELLAELAQIFREQARELMAGLEAAVDAGDARRVEHLAHTLRGSVANFGATEAARIAQALELGGRNGQLAGAAELVAQLGAETAGIDRALTELSGAPPP